MVVDNRWVGLQYITGRVEVIGGGGVLTVFSTKSKVFFFIITKRFHPIPIDSQKSHRTESVTA